MHGELKMYFSDSVLRCRNSVIFQVFKIFLGRKNKESGSLKRLADPTIFQTTNFWVDFDTNFYAYKPIDGLQLTLQKLHEKSVIG